MNDRRSTLGSLLRRLRAERGWTVKEMSARVGIPASTLSKVEHDRLTLTYDKLQQLAERLGVRMSELFFEPGDAAEARVTARRSFGRLDTAVRVTTPNYDYYYLCPEVRRKLMVPVMTRIRAKSAAEFGELIRHAGEEYIYVLDGAVEVHSEFYDPVTLSAGESMYIDSTMGHAYVVATGHEEATLLGVCASAHHDLMESLLTLHSDEETSPAERKTRPTAKAAR